MNIHEMKTDPVPFRDVVNGLKTFELRFDDRGFKVGDALKLMETKYSCAEMIREGKALEYTGETQLALITHILRNTSYGLAEGYAILSIMLL